MCVYAPLCSWCSLFDSRWIVHQDICVWFHVYVYRIATFRLPLMGTWKYNIFSSVILALWLYFSDAILTVVLSVWRSRLLFLKYAKNFPRVLYYQFVFLLKLDQLSWWQPTICLALLSRIVRPWICLHQKPLTFLILPRVDHLRRYLIYALLLSDEAMTIQHTGNKNTKPLNVSPNLTTGLPSTDIARYSTVLLSTLLICAYSHLSWFWSLVLDSSRSVLETMEKKEQMQFLMNLLQTRQDTKEKRFVEPLLICKSPHNTHSFLFLMIIPIEEKQLTQNVLVV